MTAPSKHPSKNYHWTVGEIPDEHCARLWRGFRYVWYVTVGLVLLDVPYMGWLEWILIAYLHIAAYLVVDEFEKRISPK